MKKQFMMYGALLYRLSYYSVHVIYLQLMMK